MAELGLQCPSCLAAHECLSSEMRLGSFAKRDVLGANGIIKIQLFLTCSWWLPGKFILEPELPPVQGCDFNCSKDLMICSHAKLVRPGCHHKVPCARWLKQQKLPSQSSGRLEVQEQGAGCKQSSPDSGVDRGICVSLPFLTKPPVLLD